MIYILINYDLRVCEAMKSIIYKNPVILAVTINIITLILLIYAISEEILLFSMLPIFTGVLNRRIIDNGHNIDRRKKIIIFSSFVLILLIYLAYDLVHIVFNI